MPDADGKTTKQDKDFGLGIPFKTPGFFLKGCAHLGWGMKNRLSRIFNPKSGRTVMLAFDHGYFQGPTTGLERVDLSINPLVPHADTLMLTRGILRTIIPPATGKSIVLRACFHGREPRTSKDSARSKPVHVICGTCGRRGTIRFPVIRWPNRTSC